MAVSDHLTVWVRAGWCWPTSPVEPGPQPTQRGRTTNHRPRLGTRGHQPAVRNDLQSVPGTPGRVVWQRGRLDCRCCVIPPQTRGLAAAPVSQRVTAVRRTFGSLRIPARSATVPNGTAAKYSSEDEGSRPASSVRAARPCLTGRRRVEAASLQAEAGRVRGREPMWEVKGPGLSVALSPRELR